MAPAWSTKFTFSHRYVSGFSMWRGLQDLLSLLAALCTFGQISDVHNFVLFPPEKMRLERHWITLKCTCILFCTISVRGDLKIVHWSQGFCKVMYSQFSGSFLLMT